MSRVGGGPSLTRLISSASASPPSGPTPRQNTMCGLVFATPASAHQVVGGSSLALPSLAAESAVAPRILVIIASASRSFLAVIRLPSRGGEEDLAHSASRGPADVLTASVNRLMSISVSASSAAG